jgi:broad specificity phosphatase PhoE
MVFKNPISRGCTVYYLRHGQTDWNAQERMVRLTDLPLNALGRQQAAAAGTLLGWLDKKAGELDFVAGPLLRTRQTAEIARTTLGLDVAAYRQDERLRELDFGE